MQVDFTQEELSVCLSILRRLRNETQEKKEPVGWHADALFFFSDSERNALHAACKKLSFEGETR